jgi:hypothetical protein
MLLSTWVSILRILSAPGINNAADTGKQMNLGNTIIQAASIASTLRAGELQESWFVASYRLPNSASATCVLG